MEKLSQPKTRRRSSESPGCSLLGGVGFVVMVFGAMVLGTQFPELAWKGFRVACIGFVVSSVLMGLLAAVVEVRARQEQLWRLDGEILDAVGGFLGVTRTYLEGDVRYRKRVGAALKAQNK